MDHSPTVLIVDESDDSREVIRTALARRGLKTVEAWDASSALTMARQARPDVIVMDVELQRCDSGDICDQISSIGGDEQTSLLLIGNARLQRTESAGDAGWGRRESISKPYHYGALIRKIEELLD